MMLAGVSEQAVFRLIDRGITADGSNPRGKAFLVETPDPARSLRARRFARAFRNYQSSRITTTHLRAPYLTSQDNLLFYFIGDSRVSYLGTNRFLPGAVADHLTSAGGMLTDSYQMSLLRWLEAGATASYGAVSEPCNMLEKFPNPVVLMHRIEAGESLISAYWSSVKMPGQGVFVGEPLAAPYANRH